MLGDVNRLNMPGIPTLTSYACKLAHQHKTSDDNNPGKFLYDTDMYAHIM